MHTRCFATAGLVVALSIGGLQAVDWPEFRGPTGQGIAEATGLPIAWSEAKNVAWKQTIPGKGWSSPVVAGGRVYLTSAVADESGAGQSLRAIALDAKTGKIVWNIEAIHEDAGAPRIHAKNSHASATPLIAGDRIFVHFGHQGTACVDRDGHVLWRNTVLKYAPVHGNGGSPILADGALIFSCDGGDQRFIAALNAATGKLRWRTERSGDAAKKFSFCTPLLISVNGKAQVISPASDAVYAYDPATGRELWKVRYQGYSVVPRPVFAHGLLFIDTGFDSPRLLAIRPGGTGDVTESNIVWSTRKNVPLTPSPLVIGDELYMVSDRGMASCLDARTGQVHWQERLAGSYSASPVFADGRIYFQSEQGIGTVVRAGKRFELLAKNDLKERSLASYAVADNALFIRTEKHLYRIEGR